MERDFFRRKIRNLSHDKLRELLQLRNPANREITDLAVEEAKRRGIDLPFVSPPKDKTVSLNDDVTRLRKWNWAAFLLAPLWTFAHKLERWALLTLIPGVNIIAMIYLGYSGNRLAFAKNQIKSIEEFLIVQRLWHARLLGIIAISICIMVLAVFLG
jgi:hypothetical protein